MAELTPESAEALAAALAEYAQARQTIRLGGRFSKENAGGPLAKTAGVTISTSKLNSVRQYEPSDLTVSVDAGLPWAELVHCRTYFPQLGYILPSMRPQFGP